MEATELFRTNVRETMNRKGLTIAKLASLAGTSASGMSCILSGKDGVTLERAERIATALESPLVALLLPLSAPIVNAERLRKRSVNDTVKG